MIELHGRGIDCVDSGSGPAVLFVPGSYSTTAAWRAMQKLMQPRWRMVTTSICGYGGTEETRTRDDFDMAHEIAVVEAVARHVAAPVHLVGHSFGGTIALATALAGRVAVASLGFFEANPIGVLPPGGQGALFDSTVRMSQDFEAALDGGEVDAAKRIIDFWGGEGVYEAMPEAVRNYCRDNAHVNALDWRTANAYKPSMEALAKLDVPVLLVRGGLANGTMIALTDVLARTLPRVTTAVVEGAGHFLTTSHAKACADLLESFLHDVEP